MSGSGKSYKETRTQLGGRQQWVFKRYAQSSAIVVLWAGGPIGRRSRISVSGSGQRTTLKSAGAESARMRGKDDSGRPASESKERGKPGGRGRAAGADRGAGGLRVRGERSCAIARPSRLHPGDQGVSRRQRAPAQTDRGSGVPDFTMSVVARWSSNAIPQVVPR